MDLIDFRMPTKSTDHTSLLAQCKCIKRYKSFQGTIKSMQLIQTQPQTLLHSSHSQPVWYKSKKSQQALDIIASSMGGLCVATCGLDRHVRVHHVESGQCVAKLYMKSRLNCLLYSKHEPIKQKHYNSNRDYNNENKNENDDDELSLINSEDLGTDDLWSDMETIVEEHPMLLFNDDGDGGGGDLKKKIKRKMSQRLAEVNNDEEDNEDGLEEEEDPNFKKPK